MLKIVELEAKIERLTSRGIEDMRFTIQELEAENLKLKHQLLALSAVKTPQQTA
jgi:hypothetical protein